LDLVFVGFEDGTRCYDAATGQLRWTLPLGANDNAGAAVSGDVDGDGRDEAVFVLQETLYCVGTGADRRGVVRWKLPFPTRLSTPVIADVDGNGLLSILVAGADGNVYCVKQTSRAGSPAQ
jgi:outer membrane protein assembly factor BamB